MVGKKLKATVLCTILCTFLFAGCSKATSSASTSKDKVFKIGITQIVEHPALDASRKGFIDALAAKGYKDNEKIKIDFQNAQGDIPTAQTIAKNFASQKKDLILAIATPTAQAAYNATKDIPIVITAVTDPVKSGLAKSLEKPETNVTGTSDALPIGKQFELLKKLVPNAKKVGMLYNTSEANSEIQVTEAKDAAPKFGLEIVPSGISNVNEIPAALDALLAKVDVLYNPTDNMIASSMPIIYSKSIAKKIPVIGSEKGQVESGALATSGIDYYKLGYQTGLVAVDILGGKKPQDIAITTLQDTQLVINETSATALGITIPDDLKSKAELIKGGGK